VLEQVSAFFNESEVDNTINPDETVALGAAIEADILAGNRKDILLLDVTPLSLGIETLGGLMDVIIPRNSRVPFRAGRNYTTSVDGQVNLKVSVFQGERDQVDQNRKLAEFVLSGIPAMPAGLPKIEIAFMLDADGILKVRAKELRSGVEQTIDVKPQYGLTDDQVEQMLLDSLKNAEQDMAYRSLNEAINESEYLIVSTNKFLSDHEAFITSEQRTEINRLVEALKSAINERNKDLIQQHQDELNVYTKPFAETMMDQNIAKALKGKSID
jgi:molecular chaperone HscA